MTSNGNGRGTPASDMSSSYSMDFQTRQAPRQYEDKPVAAAVPSTFNNLNSLFSSSKKVFNRMTNSIDAALKPSLDDASDTVCSHIQQTTFGKKSNLESSFEVLNDLMYAAGIAPQ